MIRQAEVSHLGRRQYMTLSGGVKVAYAQAGHESLYPLVLVHGLTDDLESFEANLPHLYRRCHCVLLDLPGHGASDDADRPYGMAYFAEVIREFTERLGLKEFMLCGHSMGGQAAVRFALDYPARVSDLILLAPAGFETFSASERARLLQAAAMTLEFKNLMSGVLPVKKNYATRRFRKRYESRAGRQAIVGCMRGMVSEPVFDRLPDLRPPTLVVFGENDELIPNPMFRKKGATTKEVALAGAKRIPEVRVRLVKGCGHFVHRQAPHTVSEMILNA